jgi:hypothetical protein
MVLKRVPVGWLFWPQKQPHLVAASLGKNIMAKLVGEKIRATTRHLQTVSYLGLSEITHPQIHRLIIILDTKMVSLEVY